MRKFILAALLLGSTLMVKPKVVLILHTASMV